MAQQELNLLVISTGLPAQLGASTAQIVRRELAERGRFAY